MNLGFAAPVRSPAAAGPAPAQALAPIHVPSPRALGAVRTSSGTAFGGAIRSPGAAPRPAAGAHGLGHRLAGLPVHPAAAPAGPAIQLVRRRQPPQRYDPSAGHIPVRRAPSRRGTAPRKTYALPNRFKNYRTRPDSLLIRRHFRGLKAQFRDSQQIAEHAQHKADTATRDDLRKKWLGKAKAARAKMTEAIGEINATNKILRDRAHWRLLRGFTPGTGFDQIWKRPGTGKRAIVEAKGPGARLGVSDRKGAQMSQSWVEMTARGMPDDFKISDSIRLRNRKVRGYVIHSTPSGKSAEKNWDKRWYN